jgi:Bcr/CflA subfamily drug resistance transporter
MKSVNFFIFLIVAIASGSTFASDIYLPSFPTLAQAFAANKTQIQYTLTVYLLGFAIFQLVWGPLSDRFGRRSLVISGLFICFLGTIFCTLTDFLFIFFIGRFLQGVGASAGMSLVRAMARDKFAKDQLSKVFSLMGMIFAISFALAPAIGGYLQTLWGWRASFWFVNLYLIFMLFAAVFYLPETNQNLNPQATKLPVLTQNFMTLLKSPIFMGFAICYGLTWSGLIAYSSLSPFIFQNVLRLTPMEYGHLAIAITAGLIIAGYMNSNVVVKVGGKYMMIFAFALMCLSSLIMLAIGLSGIISVLSIMIPMLVFVIGIGIVSANTGAGALTPFGHIASVASALYGCIQILVTFIVSWLVAHLHAKNQNPLAATLVVLAFLAVLFYAFAQKEISDVKKNHTE